jgi:hypothetical protein
MLNSNLSWYLMTAVWVLVGLAAVFPAMMSPMAFDAPGSTSNPYTVGFAASIAVFPVVCLAAAALPWMLRHWSFAKWFFLLPLADIGAFAFFILALNHFSGGQFGGGPQAR